MNFASNLILKKMTDKLLRFNKKQKYIYFDFETCGLNLASKENKPWQLAFIVSDGTKIVSEKDYLIKWDTLDISDGAAKTTGFSRAKYNKLSVDPTMVLDEFEKYIYDDQYLIIGHNILGFDVYIHNIFRKLLGRDTDYSYINRCIDTLSLSKAKLKEIKFDKNQTLINWQYRLNSFRERGMKCSLKVMCKLYDIPFDESKLHDALYDIKINKLLFEKLLWQIDI